MFLKTKQDGSLLEVVNLAPLFDPFIKQLEAACMPAKSCRSWSPMPRPICCFPPVSPCRAAGAIRRIPIDDGGDRQICLSDSALFLNSPNSNCR